MFVDAGVSATVAHDRRSAAQAGATSTGHALPGAAAFGAIATNLHLVPSGGERAPDEVEGPAADTSVAALVSQVSRGLLVTDFWYTRVLDPRTLVITGLTRNGVWLIEDGVVTQPVQNLRFTQSYPQALAPGGVLGVGSHSVGLPSGWEALAFRAPALRLAVVELHRQRLRLSSLGRSSSPLVTSRLGLLGGVSCTWFGQSERSR